MFSIFEPNVHNQTITCDKAKIKEKQIVRQQPVHGRFGFLVYNRYIITHNRITKGVEPVSPGQSIAASQPENPRPSDDRQLTNRMHHRILPQNNNGAAVELAGGELVGQRHEEAQLLLPGRPVEPLCPAHLLRFRVRRLRQRVVDHEQGAEERRRLAGGWGIGHLHGGGGVPADGVVEVELDVGDGLRLRIASGDYGFLCVEALSPGESCEEEDEGN